MYQILMQYGDAATNLAFTGLSMVLTAYVFTLVKSKKFRDISERAFVEVKTAVIGVEQTYTSSLREFNEDGKLTDSEKAEAKKRAVSKAKALIGKDGLLALGRIFDIEEWIGEKIEAYIGERKAFSNPPQAQ